MTKARQPTQTQIREFWEWCGAPKCSRYPDGKLSYDWLDLDLNNLFQYAVPKVIDKIMAAQQCSSDVAYAILFKKWLQQLELDIPNYEGTLFWAIDKVIKGD